VSEQSSGIRTLPKRAGKGGLRLGGALAKFLTVAAAIGTGFVAFITALSLLDRAFLQGRDRPEPRAPGWAQPGGRRQEFVPPHRPDVTPHATPYARTPVGAEPYLDQRTVTRDVDEQSRQ
jgi:hypothetical protein